MYELKLENENGNVVNINDGLNYVVISVSGLNPPPASIFTAKSPNRKGVKYNGSTLDPRNIIVTIKILGDIEANRNALYAWTETEQFCRVHYKNGLKDVYCEGHVEECEIDLFTDNEIVNLAILCEDPYWKELQEINAEISSLLKQFTFAFAIDSAGIPFSTIREDNTTGVFNAGAETGVKILIRYAGEVKNLRIYNANDTTKQFQINYTLPANWLVVIDTESSPKTCKGYPPDGGKPVNLIRYVVNNPTWFTLKKGANTFGYTTDGNDLNAQVSFEFSNKHLGV